MLQLQMGKDYFQPTLMNFVFQISSKPKILYICADVEVFAHKLILQDAGAGAVLSQCNTPIATAAQYCSLGFLFHCKS